MTTIPAPLFPLTFEQREQSVDSDTFALTTGSQGSPIFFPADSDQEIIIPFRVSLNQHIAILSAIDVGAALAYTDDQLRVYYWYARNFGATNMELCDYIQACIGAQLDAIQASVDAIQTDVTNITNTVNNIETSVGNSAAKPPLGITYTDNSFICGGALALVDYMHAKNLQTYAQAEAGVFDNVSEAIIGILSSIPALETLPVAALGSLSQSYFENQQATYETDFALARIPMSSLLACLIEANGGELTYDVWGDWLESVEAEVPSNAAAELFARYSPARQTLINQIAALINADQSLQSYFNELFVAYNSGEDNPSNACEACFSGLEYDFTAGQQGWTVINPPDRGTYVSGQGFRTDQPNGGEALYFGRTIGAAATINSIEIDYSTTGANQPNPLRRWITNGVTNHSSTAAWTIGNSTQVWNGTINVGASQVIVTDANTYNFPVGANPVVVTVKKVRIYFTGVVPSDWGGTPI